MIDGTMQNREAIRRAGEVVGELSKAAFVSICYLGISLAVLIKIGDRTIKTIKLYIPKREKKEECL